MDNKDKKKQLIWINGFRMTREEAGRKIAITNKMLIKGYQYNKFPNRKLRRAEAKGKGAFGRSAWGSYKGRDNIQTVVNV